MGSIAETEHTKSGSKVSEDALKRACEDARSRYEQHHPISKKHNDEACRYMPGGNTRTVLHVTPFPVTIKSGQSCYLTTADDHRYVDFLGEYTAGIYGHNHPVIKQAVEKALDGGWNYGGHTLVEQQLAQIVCERFPTMQLLRFVNSGTEANMMAVATALAYTQKKKVLIFKGSYHGGTISGKSINAKPNINLPHEWEVGDYNDVKGARKLVESLPKDTLAAILVEPMLGSGGCFAGTPEFLQSLRDLATENQALLIFDEVMTSRLSYHGMAHSLNIIPDLMTIGKWVGGGMTFGAFGGREDLMNMYNPRSGVLSHPGTFNNNVFTMHAGIAGCRLLDESRINELNALGESMRSAVQKVLQKHQIEGTIPCAPLTDDMHDDNPSNRPPRMFITGVGSLMTIHFTGPAQEHLQGLFYHHMLDQGIYMAQRGFIALSIEITQPHVDKFVQAVDQFCDAWKPALI